MQSLQHVCGERPSSTYVRLAYSQNSTSCWAKQTSPRTILTLQDTNAGAACQERNQYTPPITSASTQAMCTSRGVNGEE